MAKKLTAAEKKQIAAAQAQIKKLQAAIAKNNTTIKGLTTPPIADANVAVQKLQSGQPLTDAEKKVLGMSVIPTPEQSAQTADDIWATRIVGNTGKTQAQLDAEAGALAVAASTGGTIDPKTGKIIPPANNSGTGGAGGAGGAGGVGGGGVSGGSATSTDTPTTNIDVLKATLRGLGFTSAILDSSTSFLNSLLKEGLDYDNAVEIFLNTKEYTLKNGTKISSPFYTEYGYLNEGLVTPKTANELFNFVEGAKGVIDKYKLSSKYLSSDNLKLYVKNGVTVTDLSQRAAMAELRALEADPFQTDALIKQGFIGSAADLKDFFLDPKIGQEQLELNKQTGVFTAEALRRAKSGVITDATQLAKFKQLTATLAAKGYSEGQIANYAAEGFQNIAQDINPLTSLTQIYEKAGGTVASNAALASNIQSDLLAQEFQGMPSERRKRLSEQNIRAFQGSAGTGSTSLRTAGTSGLI
jgi:hypothetical protein